MLRESSKISAASYICFGLARIVRTKERVLATKSFLNSDDLSWMNDAEFLRTCRMFRKIMKIFFGICEGHPLFEALNNNKTLNKEKIERRARNYLMHLLCFLGTFGERGDSSNSRNRRKQWRSACGNIRNTCAKVILCCMKKSCLYLPNEKKGMGFRNKHGMSSGGLIA